MKKQKFLKELETSEDETSKNACIFFKNKLSKTNQPAEYICSGAFDNKSFIHYGLGIELYTHFTSPIRRYADILVHRLLSASLEYENYDFDSNDLQNTCEQCNMKTKEARNSSERNSDLFLAMFINHHGPLTREAIVIQVNECSFDVLINSLGQDKRIYCNVSEIKNFKALLKNINFKKLEIIHDSIKYVENDSQKELKFTWKSISNNQEPVTQTIKLLTKVNVIISKHEKNPISFQVRR